MIVNAHRYFSECHASAKQREHLPLRKQVAEALGIGEATVARVMSDWNCRNDGQFTRWVGLECDVAKAIRNLIRTANASGMPLVTAILCQKLAEHGHII